MKESSYITASNLTRLRILSNILREMVPTKDLPAESIDSFQKWVYRMVDRHHAKVETEP